MFVAGKAGASQLFTFAGHEERNALLNVPLFNQHWAPAYQVRGLHDFVKPAYTDSFASIAHGDAPGINQGADVVAE